MTVYTPGQRWVSDSESELGLGTLLSQDDRLLVMLFPASGETRHYALRNAPLTRVRFSPGDSISHHEGWLLTVSDVREENGLLIYSGLRDDGSAAEFQETMLDNFIQFRLASDRLFASQIDPCPGSACVMKACGITAAFSNRRCSAWPVCAPSPSSISYISPKTWPTVLHPGSCWLTKWAWAKPSRPAWSSIANFRWAGSAGC